METFIKIGATEYSSNKWETPSDRTFREAWKASGPDSGIIDIDMAKAREIWRNKIRVAREPLFAELDFKFMKALENGSDTSEIVKQKNALRNATNDPAIDAAKTPEELKKIQPAGLEIK